MPRSVLVIGLMLALAGASAGAGPEATVSTLKELMALLAGSGGVRARFVETRHMALLTDPLESEGRLYFAPPDRMARVTTKPIPTRLVVRGEKMSLHDATPGSRLDLGSHPMSRQLVDNVMVVLAGDLATLRQRYDLSFAADEEGWLLRLTPRARAMRRLVAAIELAGRGNALERMEVQESGGDRTVTRFFDVETGVAFSGSESDRLFALDTPAR